MFKVGDKVEVITPGDPLFGALGEVKQLFKEVAVPRGVGIVLEDRAELGEVVLWFGQEELRWVVED
jgi:hypothetical protein